MAVLVLTADQRGSQAGPDLVPAVLEILNDPERPGLLRAFERTAGDEIQGVLDSGSGAVTRIAGLLRSGTWTIGLGIGDVDHPLPSSTRAGRGIAFVLARQAVTRAKQVPHRISVASTVPPSGRQIETVAWLWAGMLTRRTPRGWEVADMIDQGLTFAEAAQRLGISQSAVSQRAQAAGLTEGRRTEELLSELIDASLNS